MYHRVEWNGTSIGITIATITLLHILLTIIIMHSILIAITFSPQKVRHLAYVDYTYVSLYFGYLAFDGVILIIG
jgi:uncharacterized membrane-anchored protein